MVEVTSDSRRIEHSRETPGGRDLVFWDPFIRVRGGFADHELSKLKKTVSKMNRQWQRTYLDLGIRDSTT
jgi:hypothetical protein